MPILNSGHGALSFPFDASRVFSFRLWSGSGSSWSALFAGRGDPTHGSVSASDSRRIERSQAADECARPRVGLHPRWSCPRGILDSLLQGWAGLGLSMRTISCSFSFQETVDLFLALSTEPCCGALLWPKPASVEEDQAQMPGSRAPHCLP